MYTTMNQLKQLIYFNNDLFIIDYMLLYFELNSWNNIMINNNFNLNTKYYNNIKSTSSL